jgi:hypothetical protein
MHFFRVIFLGVLSCASWFGCWVAIDDLSRMHLPRANVASGIERRTSRSGVTEESIMMSPVELSRMDMTLPFMTREEFTSVLREYHRRHAWFYILAIGLAAGCFIAGVRLRNRWFAGVLCLIFGPIAVAYFGFRMSRLMSGKAQPIQTPEPKATAVTPPAAQEPPQP